MTELLKRLLSQSYREREREKQEKGEREREREDTGGRGGETQGC